MSQYLEEAAALLRKAADDVDRRAAGNYSGAAERFAQRTQLAKQFADLAAVDKGLLPGDLAREVLDRAARVEGGAR